MTNAISNSTLVCVICDVPLLQKREGEEMVVSALTCGHVFHKDCVCQWLSRNASCPVCRRHLGANDIVEKLYFGEDDNPAEMDDKPSTSSEKPWYEQYANELVFAGGAVLGAIGGVVLGAILGSKSAPKKDEKREKDHK